jgi:hypothetical protein
MGFYGEDIYTEPADVSVDTLANLGPLAPLAGRFQGTRGEDVNPYRDGERRQAYIETFTLEPIDPQANGPQLYYGLRYHQHVLRTDEPATYHDQVGYFLWEPATGTLIQSLAIPRGQVALAVGHAAADASSFELAARRGEPTFGICSNPFLDEAFRTLEYRIRISVDADGSWSYEEDTVLEIPGRREPFHHSDRNTLRRVAAPQPNPLARR